MKLIVGLGNPGKEYEKTRHNIGFVVVDNFVQHGKMETWKPPLKRGRHGKMGGDILEAVIEGQKIMFLKPMEFMNRSGGAVGAVVNFYKIDPKDILVIHDDIDLPVGKVQLKLGGSSAGHNGLKDIILKLGTSYFYRLRIGVDRPADQDQVADYVLSTFKKEEKALIEDKMNEVEEYIAAFLSK